MSKPTRSKRKEIREKGARALERAASAPPEKAAEERARVAAVLAAVKPKPKVEVAAPLPVTGSNAFTPSADAADAADADGDEQDDAPQGKSRKTDAAPAKKGGANIPLVLLGLVAVAFVILFATQGLFKKAEEDQLKPQPNSAPAKPAIENAVEEPKPAEPKSAAPAVSNTAPVVVTATATTTAEVPAPTTTASAAPTTAATAAPTATAAATAKATAAPAEPKTASAKAPAPTPITPKKKPVSSDPY